jgi:hypothetical protein
MVDPYPNKPACPACARWRCSACGWTRNYASRNAEQYCTRCQSTTGEFLPVRHYFKAKHEDHLQAFLEGPNA